MTYSAESKKKELGVSAKILDRYGVVSSETAVAMAKGALERSWADIAVSVTGYAGPDADEGHSAGEAYIGWAYNGECGSYAVNTRRDFRKWNRNYFILRMMRAVYLLLK